LQLWKMGMAFLMTIRGIPMIYYGTEILMTGNEHEGHGQIRKDFPGGWAEDKTNAFGFEGRTKEQNEAFDYLQKLIKWRKETAVVQSGKLKHFIPEKSVYVYFRYNGSQTIMVVLNKNNKETVLDTKRFEESIGMFTKGKDVVTEKVYELSNLKIPPKTALILELE